MSSRDWVDMFINGLVMALYTIFLIPMGHRRNRG